MKGSGCAVRLGNGGFVKPKKMKYGGKVKKMKYGGEVKKMAKGGCPACGKRKCEC